MSDAPATGRAAGGVPLPRRDRRRVEPGGATALADRIRAEAPGTPSVTAEGCAAVAMDELNPFTVVSGRWRCV
jgi:hypothetical protein